MRPRSGIAQGRAAELESDANALSTINKNSSISSKTGIYLHKTTNFYL